MTEGGAGGAGGARLSIREIARRLDVPESTLRYYRNAFAAYIPTVGTGRNRRHPEDAVEIFRTISRFFAAGETRETIRNSLAGARLGQPGSQGIIEVKRPSERQLSLDIDVSEAVEVVQSGGRLRTREVEQLITAMMVRDREIAQMHRDLLKLVTRMLETLEARLVPAREPEGRGAAVGGQRASTPGPPPPPPPPPPPAAPPAPGRQELERLRESLAVERETVERLRRAKLELEHQVARAEREGKSEKRGRK